MNNLLNNKWITVVITKLQVAPVELDVSSQSSSSCRASRARRVERVELCSLTSSTQPKCMGSTRRTCRVVSSRVEPSGIWAILRSTSTCYCFQYTNIPIEIKLLPLTSAFSINQSFQHGHRNVPDSRVTLSMCTCGTQKLAKTVAWIWCWLYRQCVCTFFSICWRHSTAMLRL